MVRTPLIQRVRRCADETSYFINEIRQLGLCVLLPPVGNFLTVNQLAEDSIKPRNQVFNEVRSLEIYEKEILSRATQRT